MKELIFVRHGHPDHMVAGNTGGWTASHLTDIGRAQAHRTGPAIAKLLAGREFAFYSSDLPRAAETAGIIAESLHVTPELVFGLRELGNGVAADMKLEEADRIALPMTQPRVDWVAFEDAESWRVMTERVFGFLDSIADKSDLALLVAHAGCGAAVVHWWMGIKEADDWAKIVFEFDLCNITRLTTGEHGERICRLNDTLHLASPEA